MISNTLNRLAQRGFATLQHQGHHAATLTSPALWWAGAALGITSIVFAPKNTFDNLDSQSYCNIYPEIHEGPLPMAEKATTGENRVQFDVYSEHDFPYEEMYKYSHHYSPHPLKDSMIQFDVYSEHEFPYEEIYGDKYRHHHQ